MQRKLLGIINVDLEATGQLVIIYSAFIKYLRNKWEYNKALHQLFIDRREVLHNTLTESGIPMKLAGLIKMCLNET